MKSFAKQILLIAMMILGATSAWAQSQYTPQKQSNGTWTFKMPNGNRLVEVEYKQPCELAWKLGDNPVPQEGVSGYIGFEDHVTFPTLDNPHNLPVTYSSTPTGSEPVATINATTGVITFVGAGTTTIEATFAGNNDYAPQVVSYTLTVVTPPMLTLVANGNGTVRVEGAKRLVNLANLTSDYTAQDGDILTGTLDVANHPVKISVAADATVMLHNATINGVNNPNYYWAGITCEYGNATLVLSGVNTVKGFYETYPGIRVFQGKTLTIQGSGMLNASSNGQGAGIGGGYDKPSGHIVIEGGIITATGGSDAAGIGTGNASSNNCNISITGGIVTAIGGDNAAGIGSANNDGCGTITITADVTQVIATKGSGAINSIGRGNGGSCGTVTIGGMVYWDGSDYQNGGDNYLTESPLEYTGNGQGGGGNTPFAAVIDLGNGTYSVYPGTDVTLVATYDAGYHFVNWTEDETALGTNANITIQQVNTDHTITAHFEANPVLTLGVNDPLMGSVDAIIGNHIVDLSTLTADFTAQNGDVLTGTLDVANHPVKISIADGATVMLHNATIIGDNAIFQHSWAGINCEGNASLILGGENTVKGFYDSYPGIHVPVNKTLTIQGDGSLDASSNGYGAGIGGGGVLNCGNIVIAGGIIIATGGEGAAGIGSGNESSCGNISITGGTVTATGGDRAAGIGSGYSYANCGTITITDGVAQVIATKGSNAINSIGRGYGGTCGTVTIGGTVYWDGSNYVGADSEAYLGQSPLTYPLTPNGNSNAVTYTVYPGTEVTVQATPAEHNHLASWTPAHTLNEQDTAHVIVNETMTLTANFVLSSYNVTASVANTADVRGTVQINYTDVDGQSQITAAGATAQATAQNGSTSTLTATPSTGYHFVKWQNANGTQVSTENPLSVTSVVDTAFTAVFDTTKAELAWSPNTFTGYTYIDFNNYKPTLNNPHNVSVRYGLAENVPSVKVNPETGYITNSLDIPILYTPGTYHVYAVHETDQTYYYDSVVYTLNVNRTALVSVSQNIEEGGSIAFVNAVNDLTHSYSIGNAMIAYLAPGASFKATATASANAGYHFSKWQTGNIINGYSDYASTDTTTYTAPEEITNIFTDGLRAVFAPDTFTITYMDGDVELNVDTFYYLQPVTDYTSSKTGWDFIGWSPEVPELMPAENLTVYAQWTRICDSVTDYDNNHYASVNINNLCWMASNMRATHYADGRAIPNVYEYQSTLYPNVTENVNLAGRLYDWYAAMDVEKPTKAASIQGICPNDWRMPTAEDAALLNAVPATELRTTTGWVSPNYNTNSTGFSAYPAGFYNSTLGRFEGMGSQTDWWMVNGASVYGTTSAGGATSSIQIPYYCDTYLSVTRDPKDAISVRCVKD